MIVILKENLTDELKMEIANKNQAISVNEYNQSLLVLPSKVKELPESLKEFAVSAIPVNSDIQLASKDYLAEKRTINLGFNSIGGHTDNCVLITGPCSVESESQIEEVSKFLVEQNITVLRAGAYKPRTSPYSFQGLGLEGLKLLDNMRSKYGFKIITEVRDSSHVNDVISYADIIQIGAKSMYDHGILRACGKTQKPVLLKRGFGTTLQEFVQAAEFILSGGNPNVILCERGIRTFETKTRFTLDLCGVAWLKEFTNLPVVLDPSHAIGFAYGVGQLAKACLAMKIDGLLIETHPSPKNAWSDADQQLDFIQFANLKKELITIATATNQKLI